MTAWQWYSVGEFVASALFIYLVWAVNWTDFYLWWQRVKVRRRIVRVVTQDERRVEARAKELARVIQIGDRRRVG